ncbi:methionine--tRNA ligase [Candidatus Pacearchaeota archaeon]|nr:methionine--tRNA ligase [Candidatus Pacearchaeota archaeon]
MTKTFYITTPIYYPNDVPHIGHAYTTIAADILSRWNKLKGKEVFFSVGTDEHGKKIQKTAESKGKTPKEFVDKLVPEFKKDWETLNIKYNKFIRTTDKEHKKIVQEILQKVYDKGEIYPGEYSGLYCTACEAYYTERELENGCCPIHKTKIEKLEEETYFFKLSKYQKKLLDFYKKNPDFISPDYRKKEIINRVKKGLKDLSISRTSFDWGIKLPFDKKHITYVWFDALLNYYSLTQEHEKLKKFWPADIHIVGKDILWFHAVIWPAILLAADLPLPKKVFAHGWWTIAGEKMSKSTGNVIKIKELASIAGVDSARYFLFREAPFGQDGDFSKDALIARHNNELADKLGNLVSRVSGLIEKFGVEETENKLIEKLKQNNIEKHIEGYEFDKALNLIFEFIDVCNEYVQNKKPWSEECENRKEILYELVESIKLISILLWPFIPESAEKIAKHFGFEINYNNINKPLDIKKIKKTKIGVLFEKVR